MLNEIDAKDELGPVSIVILSDLHIGRNARALDLSPSECANGVIDNRFRNNFIDFIQNESISADYLMIAGDLTDSADPFEVELATEIVLEFMEVLNVSEERTIIVPGNHDRNWALMKFGDHEFWNSLTYAPFKLPGSLYDRLQVNSKGDLLDKPYFAVWESEKLIVVGYNSSQHCGPEEAVNYGILIDDDFREIKKLFEIADWPENALKIFLIHHHPKKYDYPVQFPLDFSDLQGVENLLIALHDYKFDFIVHGHVHQPRFSIDFGEITWPIGILSSGSFSIQLPFDWNGAINNQFHLLNVEGRMPDSGYAKGNLYSWRYTTHRRWEPSEKQHDGIPHLEPFGLYMQHNDLKLKFRDLLLKLKAGIVDLDEEDIIKSFPDIKYLRRSKFIEILQELELELGYSLHNKYNNGTLILLKGSD